MQRLAERPEPGGLIAAAYIGAEQLPAEVFTDEFRTALFASQPKVEGNRGTDQAFFMSLEAVCPLRFPMLLPGWLTHRRKTSTQFCDEYLWFLGGGEMPAVIQNLEIT